MNSKRQIYKKSRMIQISGLIFLIIGVAFYLIVNKYFTKTQNYLLQDILDESVAVTETTAHQLDSIFYSTVYIPVSIANSINNSEITQKELHIMIKETLKQYPDILGLGVAYEPNAFEDDLFLFAPYYFYKDNAIDYKNLGDGRYDYTKWDLFSVPREINQPVWSDPYFDHSTGKVPLCTYSMPFYKLENESEIFLGIVYIDLKLQQIQKVVSSLSFLETGYGFLISQNGTIVSHPDRHLNLKETLLKLSDKLRDPYILEIARKMLYSESSHFEIDSKFFGGNKLYYIPLKNGWSLGLVYSDQASLNGLQARKTYVQLIGIFCLILLAVVINIFGYLFQNKKLKKL